jgi:hypothetical protein
LFDTSNSLNFLILLPQRDHRTSHRTYLFCPHGMDGRIPPNMTNGHVADDEAWRQHFRLHDVTTRQLAKMGPWSYSRRLAAPRATPRAASQNRIQNRLASVDRTNAS